MNENIRHIFATMTTIERAMYRAVGGVLPRFLPPVAPEWRESDRDKATRDRDALRAKQADARKRKQAKRRAA